MRGAWPGACSRGLALGLGLLALAACVTTVVDADPALEQPVALGPLVVPLGAASDGGLAADQYYQSITSQMQEALVERDQDRLTALIAVHDRADAPAWARAQLEHFRAAALGLELELHLRREARIELASPAPPLGAPLDLELRCAPLPGRTATLRGADASGGAAFHVRVRVQDHDALGGRTERSASQVLRLREDVTLTGATWLAVPFRLDLPAGAAVVRELTLAAELLPGAASIDGLEAPLQRAPLAERRETLFPDGVQKVREQPLRTLRQALALGDEAHVAHGFVAAWLMPERDRTAAAALLIDRLRLGSPRQARAAMAALRQMTGEPLTVEDREGWLRWWQGAARR